MPDVSSARKPTNATTVARLAGVSQSTVSLVLADKWAGRISLATAERVRQAAAELNYRPNASGRGLRTGQSKFLGLAVPDGAHPFFGALFVAADQAARHSGYGLMLLDTVADPHWANRIADLLGSNQLAGCIVYSGDVEVKTTLQAESARLVQIEPNTKDAGHFSFNLADGMEQIVSHLTDLGHRDVGYFAADYANMTFRHRYQAFQSAARRRGIRTPASRRCTSIFEVEAATTTALHLLQTTPVTAVVCDDDLLAAATMRAGRQLGRRVPDELSVIGFGDLAIARYVQPELTTLQLPTAALGQAAVTALLKRLDTQEQPKQVQLGLTLTVRQSTAPCP